MPCTAPSFRRAGRSGCVSGSEEAGAEAVGDIFQVDEGEEIDGAEVAVDGGRAAEAGGDVEVGAEEAGRA